jgi:hypothetical protein
MNEAALQGLALAGTFLSASIWWVRASLAQQNRITDRFISSLEKLLAEKNDEARLNRIALGRLTGAVRRNSSLLNKSFRPERSGVEESMRTNDDVDPSTSLGMTRKEK